MRTADEVKDFSEKQADFLAETVGWEREFALPLVFGIMMGCAACGVERASRIEAAIRWSAKSIRRRGIGETCSPPPFPMFRRGLIAGALTCILTGMAFVWMR